MLPESEVLRIVEGMDKETRKIKKDILQICWYMRGMNYTDAIHLSHEERSIIGDIVKENFETTKKTKLPFF
jgi:hypothetical protein